MNTTGKTPALITWSGYLALTFLIILPLSVLTVRAGDWSLGLGLYALACLGSIVLLILFVALLLQKKYSESRRDIRKWALCTLPGSLALLSLTMSGGNYPQIHDITTDPNDPPRFVEAEAVRGAGANSLAIKPDAIEQQKLAYADLDSIETQLNIDDAFDKALITAEAMDWEIYNTDLDVGIIEAVDTTKIMGFKDDIVIRVRGNAKGAYIDLRSVSRVGRGDIGANAKRIRAYQEAFKAGQ
jgi:uncharacterized protein (DUF1499 family)